MWPMESQKTSTTLLLLVYGFRNDAPGCWRLYQEYLVWKLLYLGVCLQLSQLILSRFSDIRKEFGKNQINRDVTHEETS
jgi:hypothetical protein